MKFTLLFLLSLILLLNAEANDDWTFLRGSQAYLQRELDLYEGKNYLFNCELLIEKVQRNNKKEFWISLFDLNSKHEVAINIPILEFDTVIKEKKTGYHFTKSIEAFGVGKIMSMNIKKDYSGNWSELNYREFIQRPFLLTKNIKCSRN